MKIQVAVLGLLCAGVLYSVSAVAGEGREPGARRAGGQGKADRFAAADTDGNGMLSLAEFEAMHNKRQEKMKERLGDKYDPEKAAKRPSAAKIFERLDADANGSVTKEEMAAGRAKGRERRGGGQGGRRHGGGGEAAGGDAAAE